MFVYVLLEMFWKTGVRSEERTGDQSAQLYQVIQHFKRDAGSDLADGGGQNF